MSKKENNINTLDEILDNKYGKRGAKKEQWEQEFEAFQLGVLLEEARLKTGLTQEQLCRKKSERTNLTFQELRTTQATSGYQP